MGVRVFFQVEDAIRSWSVTGVQTCAFLISSRRRHTRLVSDWSSDVCSSDLPGNRQPRLSLHRVTADELAAGRVVVACPGVQQARLTYGLNPAYPIRTSIARPHVMHPGPQPPPTKNMCPVSTVRLYVVP